MKRSISIALAAAAAICFTAAAAPRAEAQISINIGVPPDCPYGYYDYAPYPCAPYGYYGPEWFLNGVFIGAGPWFHGPANFHGHVNNHFDPRRGYAGARPNPGEKRDPRKSVAKVAHFRGNEVRDGRGNVAKR